jgi:hypothetical protein
MDYLQANSRFIMSSGKPLEAQRGVFFLNHVLKNGDSYQEKNEEVLNEGAAHKSPVCWEASPILARFR